MNLIHKLEKARTKDELEALGLEHLGVDIDKRKAKEVLRAELIAKAEAAEAEGAGQSPAGSPTDPAEPAPVAPAAPETPKKTEYRGPLGRNKRTGRIMPWTSAMAGMPHMEQL